MSFYCKRSFTNLERLLKLYNYNFQRRRIFCKFRYNTFEHYTTRKRLKDFCISISNTGLRFLQKKKDELKEIKRSRVNILLEILLLVILYDS